MEQGRFILEVLFEVERLSKTLTITGLDSSARLGKELLPLEVSPEMVQEVFRALIKTQESPIIQINA